MRINIVSNYRPKTGLMQDVGILRGILVAAYGEDIKMNRVHHMMPECPEAEVNIFLEVVNPALFSFAARNIWIPNAEWTYRAWTDYIPMFDEIWCKTTECLDIFTKYTPNTRYIGWTSIDKVWDPIKHKKNYYKAIVPVGKNIFRNPKPILQAYFRILNSDPKIYTKLPVLNIVYDSSVIQFHVPDEIKSKVHLHDKLLTDTEYDDLLRECGLCICISACEGFGHAVNEALTVGCNVLLSPIRPFIENIVGSGVNPGSFYGEVSEKIDQVDCIATMIDTSVHSIMDALEAYVDTDLKTKRLGSEFMRTVYEVNHKKWVGDMKSYLSGLKFEPYSLNSTLPKEDILPDVSIVTITKDRRKFMPLAKYSYMIQSYPESKLEWVIVDDGDDPIEDTLFGVPNVKYVKCDKMNIADKRNLGVKEAMYDFVCMMDDDDVYPNNSILQRVAMLLKEPSKECVFCTTIPSYDICKYSSFMNVPPITLPMSQRVSEATLGFTRKFWDERKFQSGVQIAEADAFIRGREQMCREISPQEVIVSLVHPLNTSSRRMPEMKEPNGCHYGFNEKLFALVSEIGEDLKVKELA
uniref:Glycosyltransferase 2-like domain-containing protein n=1 Tax=viral metagenome TaxID=1070528 RepID=A0A6C0KFL7_9ZZZZ